jgi:hypothetical protein
LIRYRVPRWNQTEQISLARTDHGFPSSARDTESYCHGVDGKGRNFMPCRITMMASTAAVATANAPTNPGDNPGPGNQSHLGQFPSSDHPPATDQGDAPNRWFPFAGLSDRPNMD